HGLELVMQGFGALLPARAFRVAGRARVGADQDLMLGLRHEPIVPGCARAPCHNRARMRSLTLAVVVAALAAAAPAAPDDFTVLSSIQPPRGGSRPLIQYVSPTRVRISDGDRDAIVTPASGKVVLFSDRRREYWETTLDEVTAFGAQFDQALARGE